jgi:WD40 repeat protein
MSDDTTTTPDTPAETPAAVEPTLPAVDPTKTHVGPAWKHDRPLVACRFHPGGVHVFTGAEDYFVTRWDMATGKPTQLVGHDSWVRAIGCSPDGQTLYTGGYDGRLIAWEALAEKPEPKFKVDPAHQGWLRALAVSPDGQQIATCGNDKLVKLWNAADGALTGELAGHESHVYHVAFHPSGQSLVSCDLKGVVKDWDLAAKGLRRDLTTAAALHKYDTTFRADIGGARSIAFSADGTRLALGGITNVTNAFAGIGNPAVVLFDWESGKPLVQFEGKEKVNGAVWGVRHHPDGFWIGLSGGGGGGWLYFWKEGTAEEFHKLKLPDTGRDLDLSPDGRSVSIAHFDRNLRIGHLFAKPA